MIATGLTFLFGFCLALLLALLLSPLVWRRSRRMARREFEATIPTSVNEIRASYDHVRAATAIETRTREMDATAAVERAAQERADAGRISLENAGLRERNSALITLLTEHKAAFEEVAETLEFRENEFDKLEAELHETRHDFDLRSEELDALARKFRVLVDRAERDGVDTGFDTDDLSDDAVGNRPSRVGMQKTITALTTEIDTLRTGLRQEQSTVRERDATILDLLAGVATATAGAGGPQTRAEEPESPNTEQPNDVADATGTTKRGESAPGPSGNSDYDANRPDNAERPATDAIVEPEAESSRPLAQPLARADYPSPRRLPKTSADAPVKSFSSLFASRIRGALKRPQAQADRPAMSSGPSAGSAASVPATKSHKAGANLIAADGLPLETEAGSATGPADAASSPAAPAPIARRLREALQLPDHPLGTDDVDDETLRQRIVDLAARVIDTAAKIEGKASPIETILSADQSFSSLSRPRERQTLADRVRVMRSEADVAE